MEEENKNAYSEVIEILKLVDDEKKLEALPIEMLEVLKSKSNPQYKPVISKKIPLDEQNLQPETYSILSWIAMKYWNEENNEKLEETKDKENILENSKIEEKINVIDNSENNTESDEQNLLPIIHKELRWYEIIKNKIIEIFNKLFKPKEKTND